MAGETYKDAGVDVPLGNVCSKIMYEASKKTWENRRGLVGFLEEQVSAFSGKRNFDLTRLPRTKANVNADGVGTKMEIAEALTYLKGWFHFHEGIPADLIEMSAEDAVITGAEPAVFVNILDVSHLNAELVQVLADGLVKAAADAGCAVVNGETAELGDKVGGFGGPVGGYKYALELIRDNLVPLHAKYMHAFASYALATKAEERAKILEGVGDGREIFLDLEKIITNPVYNWSGAMFCLQRPDRVLDGSKIEPGHSIVALVEPGFGSNGLSLVRRILTKQFGKYWPGVIFREVLQQHRDVCATYEDMARMHENPDITLGEMVLTPCKSYVKALLEMHGGYSYTPQAEVSGAAHITGGGIPEKLGRLLKPTGFGAELNPMQPCTMMRLCQKLGGTSDREAYTTFNMGQRMIIVTPDYESVMEIAEKQGHRAKKIGTVAEKPTILIGNNGFYKKSGEKFMEFPIE